jgi:hypothetical protein
MSYLRYIGTLLLLAGNLYLSINVIEVNKRKLGKANGI